MVRLSRLFLVGSTVEADKEGKERGSVAEVECHGRVGVVGGPDEAVGALCDKGDKLEDLEHGDVLFEKAGDLEGGHEVVGVHDDVDKRVEGSSPPRISSGKVPRVHRKPHVSNRRMVVHVEQVDLPVPLPQHHKHRVQELVDLRHREQPQSVCDL